MEIAYIYSCLMILISEGRVSRHFSLRQCNRKISIWYLLTYISNMSWHGGRHCGFATSVFEHKHLASWAWHTNNAIPTFLNRIIRLCIVRCGAAMRTRAVAKQQNLFLLTFPTTHYTPDRRPRRTPPPSRLVMSIYVLTG